MFSVVVPLYNKKPYIHRCIKSILNQSFKEFELIVVDDGSTDGSMKEFQNIIDTRLIIIQQKNSGTSAARNSGIKKAQNEWIAFIDADDIWLENHLDELKKIIDLNPDSGLVSTNYIELFENEKIPELSNEPSNIYSFDYFLKASDKIGIVWTSAAAVNRSIANITGGFRNYKYGEDLEFWARIALDYPVSRSSKITSIYIRGTGGAMDTMSKKTTQKNELIKLSDLSPSVSFIIEYIDNIKYNKKRNSIVLYINSRIYGAIRGALYRGDIEKSKQLIKLLLPPFSTKFKTLKYLSLFPTPLIRIILHISIYIKNIYKPKVIR